MLTLLAIDRTSFRTCALARRRVRAAIACALVGLALAACERSERSPQPGAAGESAAASRPPAGTAPSIDVKPLRYDAQLTVDPSADVFSGALAIHLRSDRPVAVVWISAEGLTLREGRAAVTEDGKVSGIEAKLVQPQDGVAGLEFAKPLPAGESDLWIRYAGKLDGPGGGLVRDKREAGTAVIGRFEGGGARRVFPWFEQGSRDAPWKLTVTVRDGQQARSGTPVEWERASVDGWHEVSFVRTPPTSASALALEVVPLAGAKR